MCDLPVVFVPLLHLRLASRQVAADEAEAGAVELKADAHSALISRLSPHASLHGIDGHIPVTRERHSLLAVGQDNPIRTQRRACSQKYGDQCDWSSPQSCQGLPGWVASQLVLHRRARSSTSSLKSSRRNIHSCVCPIRGCGQAALGTQQQGQRALNVF